MSAESDYANAASRILQAQGQSAAETRREQARIASAQRMATSNLWTNTIGQLGQLPAQFQELQQNRQEQQVRQQQLALQTRQADRLEQAAAREDEAAASQQAFNNAIVLGPDGRVDWPTTERNVAGIPGAAPALVKFKQVTLGYENTLLENKERHAKALGAVADGLMQAPAAMRPKLLLGVLPTAVTEGHLTQAQADQITQMVQPDPNGPPDVDVATALIGQMGGTAPKPVALHPVDTVNAQGVAGTEMVDPTKPGFYPKPPTVLTPDQLADNERQAAAQTETARHNRVMEARPVGGAGAAAGPSGMGQLTPEGLDLAAAQLRITGTMIAMGMGKTPERFAVINRAAEQAKILGQSPAQTIQRQYATKADANALKQLQLLSSSAEAAENKAIGQIQIISDLSKKVPRTQIPLLNSAILAGKINLLGDPNAQLLANAIQTFSNEYGKIIEGSTGSVAGASDSSRAAARKLISAAMNQTTLQKSLDLMQREMDLTVAGYGAAINHVNERMVGQPAAAPGETPPPAGAGSSRKVYDVNGNVVP